MFKAIKINVLPVIICLVLTIMLFAAVGNISTSNSNSLAVNAVVENNRTIDVPIIMYHAVSDVQSIQGDYVISPAEFEQDLKYLTENGYTTVFIKDIADFVNKGSNLPQKPIALTFDDGYYNNYLYVYPLLQKYRCKASISPIAYYSQMYSDSGETNECYTHCTWQQLKEMTESGYIELGNHSYNYHVCNGVNNGIGQMNGESDSDYRLRITHDLTKAQELIFDSTGVRCGFIAYPFGVYNDTTEAVLKEMNFTAALTCASGINNLSQGDTETLYNLKRLIRPHGESLNNILSKWS